jgi:hypothetical protein
MVGLLAGCCWFSLASQKICSLECGEVMLAWVTSKLGFSEVDGFLLHGWGLNEQSQ